MRRILFSILLISVCSALGAVSFRAAQSTNARIEGNTDASRDTGSAGLPDADQPRINIDAPIAEAIAETDFAPADIAAAIHRGKLKLIDCSYTYFEGMPGIRLPEPFANTKTFELTNISKYDDRGPAWYWNWFSIGEHAGTHIDAPKHWVSGKDNAGVDRLEVGTLFAPAVVINVEKKAASDADYEVTAADIQEWEKEHGRVPDGAVVVMHSGWGKRWPDPAKYLGIDGQGKPHGPGFGEAAAEFLVKERRIVGLATDTVSTEAMALAGGKKPIPFPVHFMVHGAKKYQIEMLANTDKLPASGALLIIAPIKVKDGSGAPARVFALIGG